MSEVAICGVRAQWTAQRGGSAARRILRASRVARRLAVAAVAIGCWVGLGGNGDFAVAATAPIRIAVFPFTLQDFSAAVGAGSAPVEASYLAQTTEEAKRLLVRSERYSVIDATAADIEVPKGRSPGNCGECEAASARKLGADQVLIGVVTKISMMEYTITVQVRDARDGAIVSTCFSGLRMGADYSWSRGVHSLIENCLPASK